MAVVLSEHVQTVAVVGVWIHQESYQCIFTVIKKEDIVFNLIFRVHLYHQQLGIKVWLAKLLSWNR